MQDMKPHDMPGSSRGRHGSYMQPAHSTWGEPSVVGGLASQRISTPYAGSAGPVFMNMNGQGQQLGGVPTGSAPLMRRSHSGGQPSWLQSGVPARVPSASMDVFAATGASGSWGLSQSAEMLSISEDNAEEYRHIDASQYPVSCAPDPLPPPRPSVLRVPCCTRVRASGETVQDRRRGSRWCARSRARCSTTPAAGNTAAEKRIDGCAPAYEHRRHC